MSFSRRWGYSSAGRALRSQCRGRGFDPHYLHHFKLIIPFCIPFSKSSKIFFRLVLFQLKRSKFQIWNLKKNHKKNKEKRGCSGRESKFSVTCHRTAGRCSMSQKVWGCQKKYSNLPPHDKTQVLVFTAGFLALYFVYALRKWLQVKKRPTFLRARDRVDANTQEGRITK